MLVWFQMFSIVIKFQNLIKWAMKFELNSGCGIFGM